MRAIRKSSVLIAVFVGMFVSSARAEGIVTVKVPFPFVIDHKEFPAGRYDIRQSNDSWSVVAIEGLNNRSGAFAFTTPAAGGDPAGDQPALVFVRHENRYTLSEIWESSTEGRALLGVPAADRIARADTQNGSSDPRKYVLASNWK